MKVGSERWGPGLPVGKGTPSAETLRPLALNAQGNVSKVNLARAK